MRLPEGFLEEIRSRVSIADVIGRRVQWDRKKSNFARRDYWACCPFHHEKSPSFHVQEDKGFFKCFGCHEKGSMFDFVMKLDNLSFMEAVETLAAEAGLEMPQRSPAEARREARRAELTDVTEAALRYFRAGLQGAAGAEARSYLAGRGLSEQTIERFELGFAPNRRDGVFQHLRREGAPPKMIIEAGLAADPGDGRPPYDRFLDGRVMFPIRDVRGRCIAFGGRAMSSGARAKYMNSPETPLFDKSRVLYHHGPARRAAGEGGPLIVAEGYMDVIALAQAGFDAAVAPLGTAITEPQISLLWRMNATPVLALDGDAAGRRAALKAAERALAMLEPGKSLRFALLPHGRDPDDLVRDEGPEGMMRVLSEAKPLVDLLWDEMVAAEPLETPEQRAAFETRCVETADKIQNESVRRQYRDEFYQRRRELFSALRRRGQSGSRGAASRDGARFKSRNGGRGDGARRFDEAAYGAKPTDATAGSALARAQNSSLLTLQPTEMELRGRESVLLAVMLDFPDILDVASDRLMSARFFCPSLDKLKSALISSNALLDEQSSEGRSDAIRRAVVEACGADLLSRVQADARAKRPPSTQPAASLAEALSGFEELAAFHLAELARLRTELDAEDLSEADEPYALARLKMSRSAAPTKTSSPEATPDRTNALDALIASEPWKKRTRGARNKVG